MPMPMLLADVWLTAGLAVLAFVLGIAGVLAYVRLVNASMRSQAQQQARAKIDAANAEAAKIAQQAQIDAKAETIKLREQFEKDTEETRKELRTEERRLAKREDLIDQKTEQVANKERGVEVAERALAEKERGLVAKDKQISEAIAQQKTELLRIARMSEDEAKGVLLQRTAKEVEVDAAQLIERMINEAKETAEDQAREILTTAIQRYAAEHTADSTVSTVDIPSDDMKGRVIGREGRNIRAFEKATGVDVIVDDTPGVVVVSAFDPVRREIARRSLEKLIQDGRIHPARIEEVVAETEKEVNQQDPGDGQEGLRGDQHPRPARQADAASRPPALPHQLRPERAAALHRGRLLEPVDRRGFAPGRRIGPPRGTAA